MAEYSFEEEVKNLEKDCPDVKELAKKYIITSLLDRRDSPKDKETELFAENRETAKTSFMPGQIYIMKYSPKENFQVSINDKMMDFQDKSPLFLCLSLDKKIAKGINLNFCSKTLKIKILSEIAKTDKNFYSGNSKGVFSKLLANTLKDTKAAGTFIDFLIKKTGMKSSEIGLRSYDLTKVSYARYIEQWQWKYIPFLDTNQAGIAQNVLKNIRQMVSGQKPTN